MNDNSFFRNTKYGKVVYVDEESYRHVAVVQYDGSVLDLDTDLFYSMDIWLDLVTATSRSTYYSSVD